MAQKKRSGYSVSRIFTPIALSVLLAACSTQPSGPDVAQQSNILNEPTQTSEFYLMKADSTEGALQVDWLILSLKAAVDENNSDLANRIIRRLAQLQMTEKQQAEWQLARAELMVNNNQPADAIKQLNFQNQWKLDRQQWHRYYEMRSEIYQALYLPIKAAEELIYGADFLNEDQQQANSDHIWALLSSTSLDDLSAITVKSDEKDLEGWRTLAVYKQTLGGNLPRLQKTVQKWIDENVSHPAALYTPTELKEILALEILQPAKTALILPLSGKFAKQAKIIRDGFVFAMMRDKERDPTTDYVIIDSEKNSMDDIEQQLIDQDVDFVVGPLMKDKIEKLQQLQQESAAPIPMLALNFPDEVIQNNQFCYVTLSPEQEAQEAAKHLATSGYKYPLVIAPNGSYGRRMAKAFQQQWAQQQDTKAAAAYFKSNSQLQFAVNNVFGIQQSKRRIAQMDNLVGMEMEATERSRRDIDAVYIIAKDSELNLIKPFINVAINPEATPPKLYANSLSHSGIQRASQDLSGVIYSDIPMLVNPDPALEKEMQSVWSKSNFQIIRLRALGMDAYSLVNSLPNMKVSQGLTVPGQTGVLSIDDSCVVQRQLSWAEYESAK
ncbi:penicillin-binding protein activator [Vibrio gallicus]|uniref:penicillin-binding protein activator n=1 Tax=Vibrio gallicus TaxID=190897 RepID=UPI0021C25A71|nr:penicillin-binding protein activator [Vibrio gallicus]